MNEVPKDFCKGLTEFRRNRAWEILCIYCIYGVHAGRQLLYERGYGRKTVDIDTRAIKDIEEVEYLHEVLHKYGYKVAIVAKNE